MKLIKSLLIVAICTLFLSACIEETDEKGNPLATPTPTVTPTPDLSEFSVEKEDIKVGKGKAAKSGDTVEVHYVGTLTNGTQFDSSRERGQRYSFTIDGGNVIEGWNRGVKGMKVGGVRKLTIPPELAYGDQANGDIPANSTLVFEIELFKISN